MLHFKRDSPNKGGSIYRSFIFRTVKKNNWSSLRSAFIDIEHAHKEAAKRMAEQVALYHISMKNWLKSSPSQVFFLKSKESKENVNFLERLRDPGLGPVLCLPVEIRPHPKLRQWYYMISPILDNPWLLSRVVVLILGNQKCVAQMSEATLP